ncbi:pantoate--beta-alanine ligase [Raineya orbicola]|jgi:pantoate--beta-alanine ligase|uniref:Pantothenate synthetase n=1 Tax=Raineya orbicola TaxID=2016530 RepID=A0A2N3IBF8_9BACT|nr:pantoate--beta-alanine ligase [Raineya orbicola]PKQ67629.1 panC: pantoate--beta-alanine ligase [Raineya orbicola]
MRKFQEISALQNFLWQEQKAGKKIGFVPTMGALHEGHLSLVRIAKQENDIVVCSVFVNPTQFNNPEDLAKYPRTLEKDVQMLESVGCNVLFFPTETTMYPEKSTLQFHFGYLESVMEGKFRKGHFNGVALVVSKLFHIVQPHKAYFGQKDLQQFVIIRTLVQDLMFPLELVRCPIVREANGLAMSSRNQRLNLQEQETASHLYKVLKKAESMLMSHSVKQIQKAVKEYLLNIRGIELEYFEIADANTLQIIEDLSNFRGDVALCIAAYVSGVRLIDNLIIENFGKK